jgi:hypothetical protein
MRDLATCSLTALLLLGLSASPALAADGTVLGDSDVDGDGYTANQGDCDDTEADTWPGATEVCFDGRDQSCSGDADDDCMYVGAEWIRLGSNAGVREFVVDYPPDADETTAFLSVHSAIEHPDDQCDYTTTIVKEASYDRYRFTVHLEHCGYGQLGNPWTFEAQAVVVARIGDAGAITAFARSVQGNSSGSASHGESPDVAFCAAHTSDGQGDIDHSWDCDATVSGSTLQGTVGQSDGNGATQVAARFVALSLPDTGDLQVVPRPFQCNSGGSDEVDHTWGESRDTRYAFVLTSNWRTGTNDHFSLESDCSPSGATATCDIHCYGSGQSVSGLVLFVQGDLAAAP